MSKTILLADDSVTIQKVVELTFLEEDFEVVSVGSGSEAMEQLEQRTPDLVIADVHMPGPDGYEVCRTVKQSDAGTPVLLLVGTFEPFDPEDSEACGADAFLKKPFDSQELLRTVEGLLSDRPGEAPAAEAPSVAAMPSEPASAAKAVSPGAAADLVDVPQIERAAEPEPPAEPEAAAESAAEGAPEAPAALSDEDVDRIARRIVELVGDRAIRDVAWEVIPDLAEIVIKERLRELEGQVE